MTFVDTHAHLYAEQFAEDRDEMVKRALEAGVKEIYLPNVDSSSIAGMYELEKSYPENCFAMMGIHPCSVKENFEEELAVVRKELDKRSFLAIGEIGMDLYWDKTFREEQITAFVTQLNWAKELGVPIVIHSREATPDVIEILRAHKDEQLSGIFHCFGGSREEADIITQELGFYLGIGGVLTFKKSGLDKVMADVDLKYVVLETDAPYLAPTPFRGKRNESAYIPKIAEKLAAVKGCSVAEIAEITTRNANIVFQRIAEKTV